MKSKFAIITDLHFGPAKYDTPHHKAVESLLPEIVRGVVEKINQVEGLEFVINLGDLIQEDATNPSRQQDLDSAATVMSILSELNPPLYHVMGNHDCVTLRDEDLEGVYTHPLYYSFSSSNYKNIVLQCASPGHFDVHLVPGETEWLQAELANADKDVLLFMHQLLVEHPLEGTSCEGMPGCAYVRNKEEIREILEGSGKVRAVFNGHMHHNFFRSLNTIPYVSIQALTEPFEGEARTAEAYAIVEVDGTSLHCEVFGNDPVLYRHSYAA